MSQTRPESAGTKKVLIATPTAEGKVTTSFAQTLLAAATAFSKAGFQYRQAFFDGADVAMARNAFANILLADEGCTHLLFVDSDMAVDIEVFARLIQWGKPLAGPVCTERSLDLDRFVEEIRGGASKERALAVASNFAVMAAPGRIEVTNGFCKVEALGFGCVLIERSVFTALAERGLAKKTPAGKLARHGLGPDIYDFFSETAGPDGARVSEDFSFCRRAREAGFDIWGYGAASIGHVGAFTYGASFIERLKAASEPRK
ncbi:MAG: hypothetical protein VX640_00660 [Pseudomonadota bacterium]|nr:hypothetical protein [Pseudomonadota bacterium]